MKPIIAALIALPMATMASAQDTGPLEVDVVGGIQAPMAIAVPAMPSTSGDVAVGRQIAEIIASDLRTTGLFTPLGPGGIASYSQAEASNPVYATWRSAGAAALVAGYVEGGGTGRLTLACYLYDVTAGRELVRQGFAVNANDWRRAAHKCADLVYSRLSGEQPFLDTKVVYVAESGPKNARVKRIAIMDSDGSNHRYLTAGRVEP